MWTGENGLVYISVQIYYTHFLVWLVFLFLLIFHFPWGSMTPSARLLTVNSTHLLSLRLAVRDSSAVGDNSTGAYTNDVIIAATEFQQLTKAA